VAAAAAQRGNFNFGEFSTAANPTGLPPAQMPRVQSFGTEVAAARRRAHLEQLAPRHYLIEFRHPPSIQAPMGLYGILVVTTPVNGTTRVRPYPTNPSFPVTVAVRLL